MTLGGFDSVERNRIAGVVGFRRHRPERPTLIKRRDQRGRQAANRSEPRLFERRRQRRIIPLLGVADDPRREPILAACDQIAQSAGPGHAFLRIVRGVGRHLGRRSLEVGVSMATAARARGVSDARRTRLA